MHRKFPFIKIIIKSFFIPLLFTALFLTFKTCKENPTAPYEKIEPDSAAVTITTNGIIGVINQKVKFTAHIVHPDSTKQIKLYWSILDSSIASINQDGICLLKKEGLTFVYAAVLTVHNDTLSVDSSYLQVDSLDFRLFTRELHLSSDESYRFIYNYIPFKVYWSSSNPLVATVDSTAQISVTGFGSAFIKGVVKDTSGNILGEDSAKVIVEWWKLLSIQTEFTSMFFNHEANQIIVGVSNGEGAFYSSDLGENWVQRKDGLNTSNNLYRISGSINNSNAYIALIKNEGIVKTENGGILWQYIPPFIQFNREVISIALSPSDYNRVYAIGHDPDFLIYKSSNFGLSWEFRSELVNNGASPTIFFDPLLPDHLFMGTGKSYRSTDDGMTWNELHYPNFGSDFKHLINIDNQRRLYVQDYNWDGTLRIRILRSSDFGDTWSILKVLPTFPYVFSTDSENSDFMAIASREEILISKDDGGTWETIQKTRDPFAANVGIILINEYPLELIHVIGRDIWKFRKSVE